MDRHVQARKAQAFRELHRRPEILLLPNAWDAGSARVFEQRGFAAVATTSGGMAWSLGYADGEQAPLDALLGAVARIARCVELPLSVDMETGFGADPAAVGEAVRAMIDAGAAGINLEDGLPGHGPLREQADAAARIRAAREAADAAGVPIVINARVDAWLQPRTTAPVACLAEALERARAYLAAGADCIFPLGLDDPDTLAAFVQALAAPVNVAALPGMPALAALAQLGVARVSTATRFACLALGAVDRAAAELLRTGSFDVFGTGFGYPDAQRLFATH